MATTLLILSIVFFISAFGIHSTISSSNDQPMYLSTALALIPIASGFILPIIPLTFIFHYHWIVLTVANAILVFVLGSFITRAYLLRLSTGILSKDMIYSLGLGIVVLIIGIILQE